MNIQDGILQGDNVTVSLVPNWQKYPIINPEFLIEHYTATQILAEALASQYWAHAYIEPDGHITQRMPFNRWAPHAGVSEWGGRFDLNFFSIGIEHVNYGKLYKTWKGWCRDKSVWNAQQQKYIAVPVCYPESEIVIAKHKFESAISGWPCYPVDLKRSSRELTDCLNDYYHFVDIVGHDDVCAKVDPGPAFNLPEIKEFYYGKETECGFIVSRWWPGNNIGAGGVSLKWIPYDWGLSKIWCNAGTIVHKLSWQGRYVNVIRADGKTGWIAEKYLRRIL